MTGERPETRERWHVLREIRAYSATQQAGGTGARGAHLYE